MDFLRERAYPWFKETALCVIRWLQVGKNGKLALILSSSPEIHDKNLEELGMRWWVGFSFTWMSELYAIQQNGEAAAFQLKLF